MGAIETTMEQRENLAALNADRMGNVRENSPNTKQSKSATDKYPSPNAALVVILLMFAIPSDIIGMIPVVGQFVSLPMAGLLRLGRRLSHYPDVADNKLFPNFVYVLITFGGTKLSKLGAKLGKLKK